VKRGDGPSVFVTHQGQKSHARPVAGGIPQTTWIRRVVRHTLERAAPHVRGEVGVLLTDDDTMRHMNARFRGLDAPTDVLSFPLGDGLNEGEPFGDVVISCPTARRQADRHGASLREELCRLLIHGTLHLCGYDHHARREAARMHSLTRRLMTEVLSAAPGTAGGARARRKSRAPKKRPRRVSKRVGKAHA